MSAAQAAPVDDALWALLQRSGLKPLQLAGRSLLPVVQGGMGVGISAHGLAGAVAAAIGAPEEVLALDTAGLLTLTEITLAIETVAAAVRELR